MTRTRARKATPSLDIVVQSDLWRAERSVKTALRRAVAAAAAHVDLDIGEVAIVLSDDAAIHRLNRHWRNRDRPTNVLSFPAPAQQPGKGRPHVLGDVVIAYQTAAREAAAERKPFKNHVSHLAVHGFLHLLGYDHENAREAAEMEALERTILASLHIPDPFRP